MEVTREQIERWLDAAKHELSVAQAHRFKPAASTVDTVRELETLLAAATGVQADIDAIAQRLGDWSQTQTRPAIGAGFERTIVRLVLEWAAATGAQAEALERLRLAFIANGLRQFPEKSRDDIAAEADRIIRG